jgi:predicted MPP superfamily phosphohydrolase
MPVKSAPGAARLGEDLSKAWKKSVGFRVQRQLSALADLQLGEAAISRLEKRLGRVHARQRLGVERDHEGQVFRQGLGFFRRENSHVVARLIEAVLKGTGIYGRGLRNAAKIELRYNTIPLARLPAAFNGFSILHLSDLHCDTSERAMPCVAEMLGRVNYDICVITGDYRGRTFGPFEPSLHGFATVRSTIRGPVYGILGNHDSTWMLPHLEQMDVAMLMNEAIAIERNGARLHLAGIDDAHFYRTDNIEKAAEKIPHDECSILLSHTPEVYRQAAHAGFDLMLSGHTHGGQICLPGGFALTLASVLPRHLGAGHWRHQSMRGYTSVGAGTALVPVRFNCPPEITLHRLVPDQS